MRVSKYTQGNIGFTIIELLIVVAVIATLAGIAVTSYRGITRSAVATSMKSDLKTASQSLARYLSRESSYPNSLTDIKRGTIAFSNDVIPEYTSSNDTFCLTVTTPKAKGLVFSINQDETINEGPCAGHAAGPINPVAETCFAFTPSTGTLTGYYNNEGNNSSNPACPRDVAIPPSINGVAVKSLGQAAFRDSGLTAVRIPNSVTLIGFRTFENNNLTAVSIPSSVTSVQNFAFLKNKLVSVSVPRSVTSLGPGVFNNNLLPDSSAFIYNRNNTGADDTSVLISYGGSKRSGVIIPDTVSTLNAYSLAYSRITSVTIPSSVTSIMQQAFLDNDLTSVTIPSSVTSIGESAFSTNKLTSASIPSTVRSVGEGVFNNNLLPDSSAFIYSRNNTGTNDTSVLISYGGSKRSGITIPSTVSTIADHTFSSMGITSVTIPSSVTSIGYMAFAYNDINSITIPRSVAYMGIAVFYGNTRVSCSIPAGTTFTEINCAKTTYY